MLKSILVMFALVVVAYQVYLHYLNYRRLKAENDYLRVRWRESVSKKL